jgi:hypothetical protein
MDRFTIGDSFNQLELQILDQNRQPRIITNWVTRLFIEGNSSGDRPGDSDTKTVVGCAFVAGVKQITRLTGSFVADGVKVGSLPIVDGIPEGAQVLTVAALTITIDVAPIKTATAQSVRFWFGLPLDHNSTDDLTGLCRVAVGQYLDPGNLLEDVYRGSVRADIPSPARVGWSNVNRGAIEFIAERP